MARTVKPWYKRGVIYGLDVESFRDHDSDGIGDIRGVIEKLDYLERLGVNSLWLLPFNPGPHRDNGYDIMDYYGVDTRYGTPGDVVALLDHARDRGIDIITDLVVNHTSDQHPWFKASQKRVPRYKDFYVWKKEPDGKGQPAFPGEVDSVWEYDEERGEHYYHTFYPFQPDLRLGNQDVLDEIERIMAFWLRLGVKGFRIDGAAPMTRPAKHEKDEDRYTIFKKLRKSAAWNRGDAALFGEADDTPERLKEYYGEGDRLHVLFNFIGNAHLWLALTREEAEPFATGLKLLPTLPEECAWANFVRNLDELNLGRLDEHARQEVMDAFAPDEKMRIWDRGIRRRPLPMLGDERKLRLAYSATFALPGIPVVVYGDEIGIGEDLSLEGREPVRTAMQWNAEDGAGFTDAEPQVPIASGEYGPQERNVHDQLNDEDSLLHWLIELINTRKGTPELTEGDYALLDTEDVRIFGIAHLTEESAVVILANFSGEDVTIDEGVLTQRQRADFPPFAEGDRLFGEAEVKKSGITIPAYGTGWWRLGL